MSKRQARQLLIYMGIPIIGTALLLVKWGRAEAIELFLCEVLSLFGYIVSVYDIKEKKIPNHCVLLMLGAWIVIMVPFLFYDTASALTVLSSAAGGFVVSGVLFLLVYLVSRKGLGGGDVKFMAVAGLYLGFGGVLPAMLYGSILAAMVGGVLMLMKRMSRKDTMPLAPFLYVGILLTIFLR